MTKKTLTGLGAGVLACSAGVFLLVAVVQRLQDAADRTT